MGMIAPESMSSMGPILAWLEQPDRPRLPIQGTCAIGRSASNQLVLADEKVSRRHAIIHAQGENEFWLVDLGSANGTYRNGQRVTQPVQLRHEDSIQVGPFVLVFCRPSDSQAGWSETVSSRTFVDIKAVECWLLLADIESSLQLAQRYSPEQLPVLIGRWFSHCKQSVENHRGAINKYLGDGFLAYWPPNPKTEEQVAEALRELRRLQDQEQPHFRLVVHWGQVFMGGIASLGEESLSGAEVTFIFRMEKLASALRLPRVLSEPAQARLKPFFPTSAAGEHALSGFEGQFQFYGF